MPFVLTLLIIGLIAGQVASFSIAAGARVSLLDVSVCFVLLYGAYRRGRKRFVPLLWAPILSFFGVMILSIIPTFGVVPMYVAGGGLLYILRWIVYAALYWVSASSLIPPYIWLVSLGFSGVMMAALGLVQYVWYPDIRNVSYLGWDPHYQRLVSTLLDPNFTGIILAATMIVLWSIWEQKKKIRTMVLVSMIVTLIAFILTYSRSGFIAFAIGLGLWGVLRQKKAIVAGILGGIICAILLLPHTGEGRNLFRTVSSYARIGNAERAIELIREKPVFGHGFNILRFVSLQRSWIDEQDAPSRSGAGLDTSILFVGATTGISGIIVYGWLIVSLLRAGSVAYRKKKDHPYYATYISLISMIVIHSVFTNSLFYPWVMVWMWITTGVLDQYVRADR